MSARREKRKGASGENDRTMCGRQVVMKRHPVKRFSTIQEVFEQAVY